MNVSLLHRRQVEPDTKPLDDAPAPEGSSNRRALERLDRWIESDGGTARETTEYGADRALLASPAQRLGKGALRMVATATRKEVEETARATAGKIARAASGRVGRFFAEKGERQALQAFSRVPQRTLTSLAKTLPARVEAHVLEHTREIVGKPSHTRFLPGMSIEKIADLATTAVRSGARPVLSVSDNGALAFVFEHEFPDAIGMGGEKLLRVVVDTEGRLVTTFPVDAAKKLAAVSVRGIPVAAGVASAFFVSALAESEAEAATADAVARSAKANDASWTERALEFLGPYGIFESSPIAIEPNFVAIRARSQAALEEARKSLGREPTAEERQAIEQCIYNVWADAAAETN